MNMASLHVVGLISALVAIVPYVCALSNPRCERITAPMCQGLGYNTTHMPNFVGHEDQRQAIQGLEDFSGLLNYECSRFLRLFVCSVYIPLCSEHVPGAVPACRGLCEEVKKDCLPALEKVGIAWPAQLNCTRFPEPKDLCMQPPEDDSPGNELRFLQKFKNSPHKCPPNTIRSGDKCLKSCNSSIKYSEEDKFILEVWIGVWSIICLVVVVFALLTFAIQPKRFRWPARPILYLTSCGFITSLLYLIRWIFGSFACSGDVQNITKPYDSWVCISIALLITFCEFSYTLWWCTFSYVWYLSASKEWSTEAIEKISSRIHLMIWSLSLIPLVYALVSNNINLNDFTGFCEVSSHILVVTQIIIVIVGFVLGLLTSSALKEVRKILVYAGRSPYKLERLIYRLSLISLGICVPIFLSLICNFFDSFSIELLKIALKFLSIIISSFWVFSYKTFRSWNKILRPALFTHKAGTSPVTKV